MAKTATGTPRTDLIRFRVRPAERAEIELYALRADQPISEFVRMAAREYGRVLEAGRAPVPDGDT